MKLKKLLAVALSGVIAMAMLPGCSKDAGEEAVISSSDQANVTEAVSTESQTVQETDEGPIEISFLYWGDTTQQKLVEDACVAYEKETGVHIKAEMLPPNESFKTYIQTRKESGNLPDVSYMGEADIQEFYEMGILSDINDLVDSGKLPKKLDALTIRSTDGKVIAVGLSDQLMLLYYNKDMFDQAGIEYPSTNVANAWTWDEFIKIAQQLTVDVNGKKATDKDFDPTKIQTYGLGFNCLRDFHQFWAMYANGGGVVSADGKDFLWDKKESAEGLQNIVDLVYKYHVASPALYTFSSAIGSVDATIGSGGYAMYTNGSWDLTNMAAIEGVHVGVGVLPRMKTAVTMNCGAPMVVYNTSKHIQEAKDFYVYMADPAKNMKLLKSGAWLPNQADYYTDQALIDEWTSELPQDAKETILSYSSTAGAIVQWPAYYVPAYTKMNNEYTKYIDQALGGEKSVQDVFDECMPTIKQLFETGTVQ